MFWRITALARLIVLDGLRRKALLGLFLLSLTAICSGLIFVQFIPRDIGRAAGDFVFSITWMAGMLFLLFHTIQVSSWDNNERGSLHCYLARPISRTEYTLGLFTGMALLLLFMHLGLDGINWFVLGFIKQNTPTEYFTHLSPLYFLLAAAGSYCLHLVLLSVILFFSSAVRGGFPALLCTLSFYFICSGLPVVRESVLEKQDLASAKMYTIFLQGLSAIFPNFSWLDFKTLVVTSDLPPPPFTMLLAFSSILLYTLVVLSLACRIYEQRDLH